MSQEKLPRAFKTAWVKALRSGKYKQGKQALRDTKGNYCCLGVAADVAGATCITGKGFIEVGEKIRGITKIPDILKGDSELPYTLSRMNDNGDTFEQIADYIETNL